MAAQFWETLLNAQQTRSAGAAYVSSTSLTDVSPAPQLILPANFLQDTSVLKVTASGTFSNTSTPTLILGVYYGGAAGTKLAASGATTTTTGATNWPWRLEATVTVRSIGATGTAMTTGVLYLATSLTAFSVIPIDAAAQTVATIDTTTAKALTLVAQWGTSSASNTLTVNQFLVESMA